MLKGNAVTILLGYVVTPYCKSEIFAPFNHVLNCI
jgi:hypothetical protein